MTHLPAVVQQVWHYHRIADVVGGHADGSHLQRLGINADVQIAPLTSTFRAMLLLPFAFAQELYARAGVQQIQSTRTGAIATCTSRLRCLRHSVLKSGTGRQSDCQTIAQSRCLSQGQAKQVLDGQAELDSCIRELRATPAFAAVSGKP
jgi:hypothetical protein